MDERYEAMIKNANSMEAVREKCNNEGEGWKMLSKLLWNLVLMLLKIVFRVFR